MIMSGCSGGSVPSEESLSKEEIRDLSQQLHQREEVMPVAEGLPELSDVIKPLAISDGFLMEETGDPSEINISREGQDVIMRISLEEYLGENLISVNDVVKYCIGGNEDGHPMTNQEADDWLIKARKQKRSGIDHYEYAGHQILVKDGTILLCVLMEDGEKHVFDTICDKICFRETAH